MKRESVGFLVAGLAFGFLLGFGVFHAVEHRPESPSGPVAATAIPSPAGPMAPTQGGSPAGPAGPAGPEAAPMVEELKRLRQAVETDPQDVASWVRLGNLYQDVAMYAEAAGFYERALAIRPDEPDVLTDLGICHQALAQGASPEAARASYEKALELFARANAARPDHWQSLFNTAVVAGIRLGRHEEADAALRKLEAIRPPVPHLDALRQALAEQRAGATAGRS